MMSRREFERLAPRDRGWVVYTAGARADEPNVPDEKNPYPTGSEEAKEWDRGQAQAVLDAQDGEE